MKKRKKQSKIPNYIYCDGCPYWKRIWWDSSNAIERTNGDYSIYADPEGAKKEFEWMFNHPYEHKRKECQFQETCNDDCSQCKEMVSYCGYLNYISYGQYRLGDMVKVCNIKTRCEYEDKKTDRRRRRFEQTKRRLERRANKRNQRWKI